MGMINLRGLAIAALFFVLILTVGLRPALSQDDDLNSAHPQSPTHFFRVDTLDAVGAADISTNYELQNSTNELTHSLGFILDFSALEGHTRIVSILSSAPAVPGNRFKSFNSVAYDPLGSNGQLTGSVGTEANVCAENFGWEAGIGYAAAISDGRIVSDVRSEPSGLDFNFASDAQGQIEVGSNMVSGSANAYQSYSNQVIVDGDAKVTQRGGFTFPNSLSSLCAWQ
jgi:hypothetical protein